MCCEPQVKKRLIATTVLICFIVVSLLSHVFILIHADHEHDNNGMNGACTTCVQIQNAERTLKQLGIASAGLLSSLAVLLAAATIIKTIYSKKIVLTPVVLKIRMNN